MFWRGPAGSELNLSFRFFFRSFETNNENPEFLLSKAVWVNARASIVHYTHATFRCALDRECRYFIFLSHPFGSFGYDLWKHASSLRRIFFSPVPFFFDYLLLVYNKYKIGWDFRCASFAVLFRMWIVAVRSWVRETFYSFHLLHGVCDGVVVAKVFFSSLIFTLNALLWANVCAL